MCECVRARMPVYFGGHLEEGETGKREIGSGGTSPRVQES